MTGLLWIGATLCAFFVKGLCGFANTLLFTSIVSFGTANIQISPVELILGYPTNLIIIWKERKSIDRKICLPLAAMVIAGSILGVLFLKNSDTKTVKILFGIVVVVTGIEMLARELHIKETKQSKLLLSLIGILSGFLCGLYGVGVLLAAYVSRITEDTKVFKANMCIVFFIENTFRIVLYAACGILTADLTKKAAMLMPFMLVGLGAGMLCARFVADKGLKKTVIVLLIASGIALIANTLEL